MGPPYGKRDPYHSHIFRDSYGSGMGIVWEAFHKGVPLLPLILGSIVVFGDLWNWGKIVEILITPSGKLT